MFQALGRSVSNSSSVHILQPMFWTSQMLDNFRLNDRANFHGFLLPTHEFQVIWHHVYNWCCLVVRANNAVRSSDGTRFANPPIQRRQENWSTKAQMDSQNHHSVSEENQKCVLYESCLWIERYLQGVAPGWRFWCI